jgi:hypothetical protein
MNGDPEDDNLGCKALFFLLPGISCLDILIMVLLLLDRSRDI